MVIFTHAIPDHRCLIPTLDNNYKLSNSEVISYAIPTTEPNKCNQTEPDQCNQYDTDWTICDQQTCTDADLTVLSEAGKASEPVKCQDGYLWNHEDFNKTLFLLDIYLLSIYREVKSIKKIDNYFFALKIVCGKNMALIASIPTMPYDRNMLI